MATGLSTEDDGPIDVAITREEEALALLIGPLDDERTQTLYPGAGYDGPLTLARFVLDVDDLEVTDGGTAVAVRLLSDGRKRVGGCIERVDGAWSGTVEVTYEPADEERLKRYLIEATRDALAPDRERVPAEDRASASLHRDNADAALTRLLRDIVPAPRGSSTRIRGSLVSDRVTA